MDNKLRMKRKIRDASKCSLDIIPSISNGYYHEYIFQCICFKYDSLKTTKKINLYQGLYTSHVHAVMH